MKKTFIIHPFLFAIFPILFIYSFNIGQVSFSETLLPFAILLGFTLLLLLLSRLILRDNKKAGIIVSIFLVSFFSYGHIYNLIEGWQIGIFLIGRHRYLMPILGMLSTFSAYFIIKTHRDLRDFTNILNTAAFSLVVISLINIGVYNFKTKGTWQDNGRSTESRKISIPDLGNTATFRDIYYIILDGYASSRTLKEIYDFDNYEFTDYLTEKGFYIASKSRSNYAYSNLSLASSLNTEYINYIGDIVGRESKNMKPLFQMIENSKAMNFLKSRGYKFIHFSSGYSGTSRNRYADLDVRYGRINAFLRMTILTTALKPFMESFIAYDMRKRILYTFSKLAEIHRIEGPKFIFVHIVSPHPPYLFGANGKIVPQPMFMKRGDNLWAHKEDYLNQLIFINKKTEILINEILSKSDVSPIIILQADHGSASTLGSNFPNSSEWDYPAENMLRERMGIFNAYYLPAHGDGLLYDSITPVNTFRLIFDFYFDASCGLLNDQSYHSTSKYPYKFINVTDKLRYD